MTLYVSRTARIAWLRSHPEIMSLDRPSLIKRMRESGIISSKTVGRDVNLYRLLAAAGYPRRDCARFSHAPQLHGVEATR